MQHASGKDSGGSVQGALGFQGGSVRDLAQNLAMPSATQHLRRSTNNAGGRDLTSTRRSTKPRKLFCALRCCPAIQARTHQLLCMEMFSTLLLSSAGVHSTVWMRACSAATIMRAVWCSSSSLKSPWA